MDSEHGLVGGTHWQAPSFNFPLENINVSVLRIREMWVQIHDKSMDWEYMNDFESDSPIIV